MQFTLDNSAAAYRRMFDEFGLRNRGTVWFVRIFFALMGLGAIGVFFSRGAHPGDFVVLLIVPLALAGVLLMTPGLYGRYQYWQAQFTGSVSEQNLADTLVLGEEGACFYRGGKLVATYTYYALGGCVVTESFVFLCAGAGPLPSFAGAVRRSAFQSPAEQQQFEMYLASRLESAHALQAPQLAGREGACLWRFTYTFDKNLVQSMRDAIKKPAGKKLGGGAVVALGAAGTFVLLLAIALVDISLGIESVQYLMPVVLLVALVLFFYWQLRRDRFSPAAVQDFFYGPTTLEITAEGLHLFNTKYEGVYPWQEITAVQLSEAQGIVLLRRKKRVITALPLNCAPGEQMQAAVQFAQQHTGQRKEA